MEITDVISCLGNQYIRVKNIYNMMLIHFMNLQLKISKLEFLYFSFFFSSRKNIKIMSVSSICLISGSLEWAPVLKVPHLNERPRRLYVTREMFCFRIGMKELIKVRADCQLFVVPKAAANITQTIYRLGMYRVTIISSPL